MMRVFRHFGTASRNSLHGGQHCRSAVTPFSALLNIFGSSIAGVMLHAMIYPLTPPVQAMPADPADQSI
jgi:hypothetical protein